MLTWCFWLSFWTALSDLRFRKRWCWCRVEVYSLPGKSYRLHLPLLCSIIKKVNTVNQSCECNCNTKLWWIWPLAKKPQCQIFLWTQWVWHILTTPELLSLSANLICIYYTGVWRISRWLPSGISKCNNFSISESWCHPNASHQFQLNASDQSEADLVWRFSR